jgi:hypothetical protein
MLKELKRGKTMQEIDSRKKIVLEETGRLLVF